MAKSRDEVLREIRKVVGNPGPTSNADGIAFYLTNQYKDFIEPFPNIYSDIFDIIINEKGKNFGAMQCLHGVILKHPRAEGLKIFKQLEAHCKTRLQGEKKEAAVTEKLRSDLHVLNSQIKTDSYAVGNELLETNPGEAIKHYDEAARRGHDNALVKLANYCATAPCPDLILLELVIAMEKNPKIVDDLEEKTSAQLRAKFNRLVQDNLFVKDTFTPLDDLLSEKPWDTLAPLLDDNPSGIKDAIQHRYDSHNVPTVPTLRAAGKGDDPLPDVPHRPPQYKLADFSETKLELSADDVHPDLRAHVILSNHYAHWSLLARGCWGELDKLQQTIQNCAALRTQLDEPQWSTLPGREKIQEKLEKTQIFLTGLQQDGPSSTYIFCNRQSDGTPLPTIVKDIRQNDAPLTHVTDAVFGHVDTRPPSVFVQGLRSHDAHFISEAYVTPRLSADPDGLKQFVFNQIESFHADRRNVGQKIIFEGNFTKNHLVAAIQYCQLRDYPWEIDDSLKNKILRTVPFLERADLEKLLTGVPSVAADEAAKQSWKTWLEDHDKYPFTHLREKAVVEWNEKHLGLSPVSAADSSAAKLATTILSQQPAHKSPFEVIDKSDNIGEKKRDLTIAKSPAGASITISHEEEKTHTPLKIRISRS